MPGTSGGMPPGTGLRPGSGIGRKPPGTGRLRTGVAPSGPGTQAAQGVALSASISVLDRPVTGQGVMGMKTQGLGTGRLVEDNSYYIGLLRKKITDVGTETRKLRTEIDQQSKDNSAYTQLEKKYETLSKEKEKLEGQLADYNLAMDKVEFKRLLLLKFINLMIQCDGKFLLIVCKTRLFGVKFIITNLPLFHDRREHLRIQRTYSSKQRT
jgi:hypothetical protein